VPLTSSGIRGGPNSSSTTPIYSATKISSTLTSNSLQPGKVRFEENLEISMYVVAVSTFQFVGDGIWTASVSERNRSEHIWRIPLSPRYWLWFLENTLDLSVLSARSDSGGEK